MAIYWKDNGRAVPGQRPLECSKARQRQTDVSSIAGCLDPCGLPVSASATELPRGYHGSKAHEKSCTPVNDFGYFYQHTQKGSPMRKFLVDLCIFRFRGEDAQAYRTNIQFMPREMAVDIMIALARRADGLERGPPFAGRKYHVPVKS